MSNFKVGDVVKHKLSYLKTTGFEVNAPRQGKIVRIKGDRLLIYWTDEREGYTFSGNVELVGT